MCQLFCDNEISDTVEPGVNAAFTPEDIDAQKQHEKNEEIFEKGVRHGFWNVKTKEEIKEKYEKYKHLEDWYES